MEHSVTLSRTIQSTAESAYRALSTSGGLAEWCAHAAQCELRPDGYFFFWAESGYLCSGTIGRTEEKAVFEVAVQTPFVGRLRFTVRPQGEGIQVILKIESSGPLAGEIAFWDAALNNLKAVLETGLDRRIYDRPMLGILIGGLMNAEIQERLDSPAGHGIIISGTVSGMGAADLGLVDNDILVEMNGVELHDYHAIPEALAGSKAGDTVSVAWYRGRERKTGTMRLSGRPTPYLPSGPAELAEYVRGIYDRLDGELAEILDGVTEEEAAYRPEEKEWNTREVIAHSIATERAAQLWIANIIQGEQHAEWSSNGQSLVKGLADVYPGVGDLVAALRQAEDETVAMIRRLPPELVNFKALYINLVSTLGEHGLPVHTRRHYETIRTLVEQARRVRSRQKAAGMQVAP